MQTIIRCSSVLWVCLQSLHKEVRVQPSTWTSGMLLLLLKLDARMSIQKRHLNFYSLHIVAESFDVRLENTWPPTGPHCIVTCHGVSRLHQWRSRHDNFHRHRFSSHFSIGFHLWASPREAWNVCQISKSFSDNRTSRYRQILRSDLCRDVYPSGAMAPKLPP